MTTKNNQSQLDLFGPRKETDRPAVGAEEILPGIAEAEELTHDAVVEVLPREGIQITSMRQLSSGMYVTFIHPDTKMLVSGRIFDDDNDSQPSYRRSRSKPKRPEEFYICTNVGGWRENLTSDKVIRDMQIYETRQARLEFAPKGAT